MHKKNLKIIKIILVAFTLIVTLNMIIGISILRDNFYWKKTYFSMQWDYIKANIEYSANFKNTSKATPNLAENVPILLYHGVISDDSWHSDGVNVSFKDFKNQMFILKQAGWQTITLKDYIEFTQGKKELPEKSFLLTFDDGRKDSYFPVDPILKVLDYSAVMFVITNRSLRPDNDSEVFHLSKDELQKMIESGRWEIESHGKNDHDPILINENGMKDHFLSKKMWISSLGRAETEEEHRARITKDFLESKNDIEKNLGVKVTSFAYPYGDFGETIENFPESRGLVVDQAKTVYNLSFCQAASSDFPTNFKEDSFLAKRISVGSPMTGRDILKIFNYNNKREPDYEDYFLQNNDWLVGRGIIEISNGTMTLFDSELEGSSIAFLGGSYLWQNYSVKADVRVNKTDSFALTTRYHDQHNNVACIFSDQYVSLVQKLNSEEIFDIREAIKTNLANGKEVAVGMSVNGNKASCFLEGKEVINGDIDPDLYNGGVGFKVWDTLEKGSSLTVRNFKTEKISENNAI